MPDTGRTAHFVGRSGPDRRVARSVQALLQAFIALMQEGSYARIRVADIAGRANVGRSTFYDHFRSKDEILLASMGWMFAILAGATDPKAPRPPIEMLVAHFWDNRRLARSVLAPPTERRLRRALAAAVEEKLGPGRGDPALRKLDAVRIAAGQLGLLEAWTKGEVTASADQIVDALIAQASGISAS